MKLSPTTYYVWIGGSCDYGHKERAGGGAYIVERDGKEIARYVCSGKGTTEFRMMLTAMVHALDELPQGSDILFMTNVSYIQNFNKVPTEKSANADLILACLDGCRRHHSVDVKIVPYHKFPRLPETHELAHEAMRIA